MPKAYMKMKKAMTWNKKHKGTGETVGKSRHADEMAGEMIMDKKRKRR